jgi:hypothetical protein
MPLVITFTTLSNLFCIVVKILKRSLLLWGKSLYSREDEIRWCNLSAMCSVKQIKEEQHDMGNDQFNVYIYSNLFKE